MTRSGAGRGLEAVGQHPEGEQAGEQGLSAGVAEAQRRGALAVDDARPMEIVEPSGSDGAVVALNRRWDATHASSV